MIDKKSADLLKLGIGLLVIGVLLAYYSLVSFIDFRTLSTNIDFDSVDNNFQMSDTDKYYRYLSYSDYLNKKLDKNKDLIIKNESCAYIDFAHHNAIALSKISEKMTEQTKKDASIGVLEDLYSRLDDYSTCKNYRIYKDEIKKLIDSKEKEAELSQTEKMNMFLNKEEQIPEDENFTGIERVDEQLINLDQAKASNYNEEQNISKGNLSSESTETSQKDNKVHTDSSNKDYPQIRY